MRLPAFPTFPVPGAPPGTGVLLFAALLLAGPPTVGEAEAQTPAGAPEIFADEHFEALEWRNVGPNRGGRSIAVAATPSRPLEYYFGATGGGLWKTTDAGNTWNPVGDEDFRSSSVGALAQCYADPDVVYAGFGEVQLRGNVIPGDGVYRSDDAGETWTHIGLESSTGQQMIGRVRVHPGDCNRVYVAALGDPFGPNEERGVYRSTDAGETWEKVLYRGDRAGAVDLILDPSNPDVLYAGFWEVYRKPWLLSSGGEGSGLFKSTDGGDTWTELTDNPGLPTGLIGKVGVSVSGADSDRVYAIIESEEGGVFVSDDAGATWELVSTDRDLRQRAFYYTRIYADPQDRETVYVVNVTFWRSTDGGEEWESVSVPHGDNHDLWIDPNDNRRMINANDGGANVSFNAGETWTDQRYPTAQMYNLSTTNHFPYHICGGQQDNSTACVPSDGDGSWWYAAGGCETGPVTPHREDLDVFYAACYGGTLTRFDRETGQARGIHVWPVNPMGHSAGDIRERFQWNFPITASYHDPDVVYVASQHLFRSSTGGQNWDRISPDLTYGEPETLGASGGPITRDQTSVEYYGTIWRIAPSPHDANTIWTGSDDGMVHVTRDGGESWQNVTPPDLPKFSRIHEIDVSQHAPGKAYVAAVRYRMQDVDSYAYRTEDYGQTWTKIVDGIADGHFVRTVREDHERPGLLFAGTEHGVYVSFDDGGYWQSLRRNLPDVSVQGLVVKDDDVVIASHGRSYWVLDNIEPLRQISRQVADSDVHLYRPADAVRSTSRVTQGDGRNLYRRTRGFGAEIDFYLETLPDSARLEILEADGDVVNTFLWFPGEEDPENGEVEEDDVEQGVALAEEETEEAPEVEEDEEEEEDEESDEDEEEAPAGRELEHGESRFSAEEGLNRFTWDMRYVGPRDFPDMIMWAAGTRGPIAPPGEYQVRLTAYGPGTTHTQPFRILKDPRLTTVTQADFEEQFELAMSIRNRTTEANEAVILIRDLKDQVDDRLEQSDDSRLSELGTEFSGKVSDVEQELYQVRNESRQDPLNYPIKLNNQIAALQGVVESADFRPTDQSFEAFGELSEELDGELFRLRTILEEDLDDLNDLLRSLGLEEIEVPGDAPPDIT